MGTRPQTRPAAESAATPPHLTGSSLLRGLQRHGISRQPDVESDKPAKERFKRYPIGSLSIDNAEVRAAEAGCI